MGSCRQLCVGHEREKNGRKILENRTGEKNLPSALAPAPDEKSSSGFHHAASTATTSTAGGAKYTTVIAQVVPLRHWPFGSLSSVVQDKKKLQRHTATNGSALFLVPPSNKNLPRSPIYLSEEVSSRLYCLLFRGILYRYRHVIYLILFIGMEGPGREVARSRNAERQPAAVSGRGVLSSASGPGLVRSAVPIHRHLHRPVMTTPSGDAGNGGRGFCDGRSLFVWRRRTMRCTGMTLMNK